MYFNVMVLLAFLIGQRSVDGITSLASLPAKEEVIVPKTCTMERVYRLIGYDCSKMDLKDIPQTLKTSLEVRNYEIRLFLIGYIISKKEH